MSLIFSQSVNQDWILSLIIGCNLSSQFTLCVIYIHTLPFSLSFYNRPDSTIPTSPTLFFFFFFQVGIEILGIDGPTITIITIHCIRKWLLHLFLLRKEKRVERNSVRQTEGGVNLLFRMLHLSNSVENSSFAFPFLDHVHSKFIVPPIMYKSSNLPLSHNFLELMRSCLSLQLRVEVSKTKSLRFLFLLSVRFALFFRLRFYLDCLIESNSLLVIQSLMGHAEDIFDLGV